VVNILITNKKSSAFFEKHTKYCTLLMIIHNIYSRKDILLQELERGVEVLRFNEFFLYLAGTQAQEKAFCVS
jgi:hypothetical protein